MIYYMCGGINIMNANNLNILYLDSSSIIRNIPTFRLCKILTRKNYEKSHKKIEELIATFNSPYEKSYKNELLHLLESQKLHSIITMDCSFLENNKLNPNILNLFGTISPTTNSDLILFDEDISFDKYKQSYILIKKANIIIYDKDFCKISIGKHLLNAACISNIFCIKPNSYKNARDFIFELDNIINHCCSNSFNQF